MKDLEIVENSESKIDVSDRTVVVVGTLAGIRKVAAWYYNLGDAIRYAMAFEEERPKIFLKSGGKWYLFTHNTLEDSHE